MGLYGGRKEVTATIEGRTYVIPEIWLAGFCQRNGCDVGEAVRWWHEQELMAEGDRLA